MNSQERKLFLQKLQNDSDSQLPGLLHYYRENGDAVLLPNVLELLVSNRSQEVKSVIYDIISSLKTSETAFMAFDFMSKVQDPGIKKSIISSLWLSGMDFTEKAEEIVNMLLSFSDFEIVFDILTLLENCTSNLDNKTASMLFDRVLDKKKTAQEHLLGIYQAAEEYLKTLEQRPLF